MLLLWIALSTLVSEDLATVGAGLLVSRGELGYPLAALAAMLGIFGGDLLLFLAGRTIGRPALAWGALRRWLPEQRVEQASAWLRRRGLSVILLSRFTPGLRLPTYFAAGLLKTSFWVFAGYLLLAALLWTPLLVGAAALAGEKATGTLRPLVPALALIVLLLARRVRWRRFRWEFWPPWAAYLPVALYILYLAWKHRSLTLFTAANPGISSGGLIGESKSLILTQMDSTSVARFARVRTATEAREFMQQNRLEFPVVLKPDVGQRGSGVAVVRSSEELERYLSKAVQPTILQEYVPGVEFGVFYYRYPGQDRGRIFSITEKRFPEVTGDGASTLEQLIRRDERAGCLAGVYLRSCRRPACDVVPPGERVRLVELGSHCRGAIFLDGGRFRTAALEEAVDRISRSHPGFFFGRFDLRAASVEAFKSGEFRVIELNGVSAEATHIYDPAVSLLDAYRTLFAQWRIAFEIGAANRARGFAPLSLGDVTALVLKCTSWTNRRTQPYLTSAKATRLQDAT